MSIEKMTIHRGLAELKLIDAKIEKQIAEINPVSVYQKNKLILGYITEKDFVSNAQSKFDSITTLISRKTTIKAAIMKANGDTHVTIADKTMTITDAINFKSTIKFKKSFNTRLRQLHTSASSNLNKNNEIVEKNVQILLEQALGKDNVKTNKDDVDAIRSPYLAANTWYLFDPLSIIEKLDVMEKEISDFETEIDAVLSEINATTFIVIGEEPEELPF